MVAGCNMGAAIAAAAALLEGSDSSDPDSPPSEGASPLGGSSTGCVVMATFQFVHRAEWLQAGARLILRDRGGGCIAGAGVVHTVHQVRAHCIPCTHSSVHLAHVVPTCLHSLFILCLNLVDLQHDFAHFDGLRDYQRHLIYTLSNS